MEDITTEQLNELNKLADEQHKLNRLITYIESPEYIVMFVDTHGLVPLTNKIYDKDDELKVYFEGSSDMYVDLFNITVEDDIKIYKEVIFE